MHALHELRDMLCSELEEYGKKGELSASSLDIVDKLTHTIKNLDKIIENYDEEYSNRGMSYRGRSYGTDHRYSRRYSRAGDMVERLRDLMNDAPDDHTRTEIQRLVTKMEQM